MLGFRAITLGASKAVGASRDVGLFGLGCAFRGFGGLWFWSFRGCSAQGLLGILGFGILGWMVDSDV